MPQQRLTQLEQRLCARVGQALYTAVKRRDGDRGQFAALLTDHLLRHELAGVLVGVADIYDVQDSALLLYGNTTKERILGARCLAKRFFHGRDERWYVRPRKTLALLKNAATTDADTQVRLEVVAVLPSVYGKTLGQMLFFRRRWRADQRPEVIDAIVEKAKKGDHQRLLLEIALRSPKEVGLSVLSDLDEDNLATLVRRSGSNEIIRSALRRVDNKTLLEQTIRDARSEVARVEAKEKLNLPRPRRRAMVWSSTARGGSVHLKRRSTINEDLRLR